MTPATACSSNCHRDWSQSRLSELIDHLVQHHHALLRQQLPRLVELANRCGRAQSGHATVRAHDIRRILSVMSQELHLHMHKEELVLFPWIRQLESRAEHSVVQKRSLVAPIKMMRQEHRFTEECLARLRWLTNDFAPLEPCSAEYRLLLSGLVALEADLQQHLQKENDVLFPRAMELESIAILDEGRSLA